MNLRHTLENAEKLFNGGSIKEAEGMVSWAKDYLMAADPEGKTKSLIVCCFIVDGDIIHCGRTPDKPLFPGTIEQRIKLCGDCRKWCGEKIKELEVAIKERKSLRSI